MFGFRKKKVSNPKTLYIEIGGATIAGALVEHGDTPTISAVHRHTKFFDEKPDAEKLFAHLKENLGILAEKMLREGAKCGGKGQPACDGIICAFSSPWVTHEASMFEKDLRNPTKVTPELLKSFLLEKYTEKSADLTQIERVIPSINLNGYPVVQPWGLWTEKIAFPAYEAFVPKGLIDETSRILERVFHARNIAFASHPYLTYETVRGITFESPSYATVHISPESTDIAIVKNGILHLIDSFSLGANDFIRPLNKIFGSHQHITESTLNLMYKGHASGDVAKAEKALQEPKEKWEKLLNALLSLLPLDEDGAYKLFLIAPENIAPIVTAIAKDTLEATPARQRLILETLTEEVLNPYHTKKTADTDVGIMLGILGFHSVHGGDSRHFHLTV